MEKIKSKKAGAGLGLLLAGTLAMASLPMIGCGDDGKNEQDNQGFSYWDDADIMFHKDTGVNNAEANDIIAMFKTNLVDPPLSKFAAKIDNIYVTTDSNIIDLQGRDLYIGRDATDWTTVATELISLGLFATNQKNNGIMLANKELNHQNDLKHTVVLPQMKKIEAERQA